MGGIVEVPVSARTGPQSYSLFSTRKDQFSVFDQPLSLVLPRTIVLLLLWIVWTFTWSGITWAFLSDLQVIDTPTQTSPLSFWDQWYFAVLNTVNRGANDINPTGTSGRIWLAIYVLFTIAFLYALVSVL